MKAKYDESEYNESSQVLFFFIGRAQVSLNVYSIFKKHERAHSSKYLLLQPLLQKDCSLAHTVG